MSLEPDWNRLAIDRVYLDECTVNAYQERARLKNRREALRSSINDIDIHIRESDVWLQTLEDLHCRHAKEIKPKETA